MDRERRKSAWALRQSSSGSGFSLIPQGGTGVWVTLRAIPSQSKRVDSHTEAPIKDCYRLCWRNASSRALPVLCVSRQSSLQGPEGTPCQRKVKARLEDYCLGCRKDGLKRTSHPAVHSMIQKRIELSVRPLLWPWIQKQDQEGEDEIQKNWILRVLIK